MSEQQSSRSSLSSHVEGKVVGEQHYYVQVLTESIFVVRKCLAEKPGPDDSIVRSFNVHHDALSYASSMNAEFSSTSSSGS